MAEPHKPVDPRQSFPELEEQTLARWRELGIFEQSIKQREGADRWVFYEGPPTANGRPGAHHVLARVFKDIFPRFRSMQGYLVERKGGWDCHGLPVELAVEEQLGFSGKHDIEKYGIAEFNQKCRDSVFTFLEEWEQLTERIGFWVDLDEAYRTLDGDYVESVWWALSKIAERGLLYQGYKVVPYCTRCGTALSSHEVALGYKDVTDSSVYLRFPLADVASAGGAAVDLQPGDSLLVWTTTPWTLPSNVAAAVRGELTYALVEHGGRRLVLATDLVERVLGEGVVVLAEFQGSDLIGVVYEPPFEFLATDVRESVHPAYRVIAADFVTASDGTGVVHLAPPFGADDYDAVSAASMFSTEAEQAALAAGELRPDELAERAVRRVDAINPVGSDGKYDDRLGDLAGVFVKDADGPLTEQLKASDKLVKVVPYEHSYPHCWRDGTPLIYYARPSWYIATEQVRERMVERNQAIGWHPDHIRDGRFGDWLAGNVDWAISRERYWGTPLPIWRTESGKTKVIGSIAELEQLSGKELADPHRPFVDEVTFTDGETGEEYRRVPEVLDVWFDSGAMPFAQHHYPFENEEEFKQRYPADFICEAIDQTRGWFYSLLAVSTLLEDPTGSDPQLAPFNEASYRDVVCLGLILDPDGQKMSKSKGNVVLPAEVIDTHGADAFRWYYLTAKQPWDGYRFSVETIGESVRQFLLQLWNTYGFYVLYANAGDVQPQPLPSDDQLTELDRWILSRLANTTAEVTERLERFDATFAGRAIQAFVDDLSNWYVRRSRRRFWDADPVAFATLRHVLVTTAKLLAPFTPFVADEIYTSLEPAGRESVHLVDFPKPDEVGVADAQLEQAMATARETVRLGLAARGQAKVKIRQPLGEAVVVAAGSERNAIERLAAIVEDELNVKSLRFVTGADELGSYEVKPNYRTLGPRFGKQMPQVAAAVAALDPDQISQTVEAGGEVGFSLDGVDHTLGSDDLQLALQPLPGYQLEREGSHAVALDLTLDEPLVREGLAREIVHAVQGARKDAGLEVSDRIELALGGADELLQAAHEHQSYIASEVLATKLEVGSDLSGDGVGTACESIGDHELRITLRKA